MLGCTKMYHFPRYAFFRKIPYKGIILRKIAKAG